MDQLTTTTAATSPHGDYEVLTVFSEISATAFKMTLSGEAADDGGEVREIVIPRVILRDDWRSSRTIRTYFHESDPPQFPGTTPEMSAVAINELRTLGRTAITYLDVEPAFGTTVISRKLSGSLVRVANGPAEMAVLVNGRLQPLRVLHVVGRLSENGKGDEFDFVILDDPENPLILKRRGPGISSVVTRIEFPEPTAAATSLEHSLAQERHALLYGIYFKFSQAEIRPESELVLKELAGILKNNPSWKLVIAGHTDSIGDDPSNLELSRKRAQSVKSVLVEKYGIGAERLTSAGFGASQPQANNDTAEGRARNRRVELNRL